MAVLLLIFVIYSGYGNCHLNIRLFSVDLLNSDLYCLNVPHYTYTQAALVKST